MDTPKGGRRPAGKPLHGDEADLFREFNSQFVRIVQRRVNASRDVVDDACAFAWQQFLQHQPERDRNWRAWMVRTAEREAWRLDGVERRHTGMPVDELASRGRGQWETADEHNHASIRLRLREALEAFARLPDRRRDIKALQITGFSYEEIAEMRGLTYTRVNRLLTEANATLRAEQERAAVTRAVGPPRAVRLEELEHDPPTWLRRAIGRRPGLAGDRRALVAWRRAALSIDDYRRTYARHLGDEPMGDRPRDGDAAKAYDLTRSAIAANA